MSDDESRTHRAIIQNLEKALSTIDNVSEQNDISSDARATATNLYRQTLENHSTFYGWDIETAASACLYLACKVEHEGISPSSIAEHYNGVSEKVLLRRAKQLRTELGLEYVDIVDPTQYIGPYTEELGADDEIRSRAEEIVDAIMDTHLVSGRNPRAVAAAAIYNASLDTGERIIQSDIAKVADVTEVTIRNRYQEQREFLENK